MAQPEQLNGLEIVAGILGTTIREDPPRGRTRSIYGTDTYGQVVSVVIKQVTEIFSIEIRHSM